MSPIAEKIESEKKRLDDSVGQSMRDKRISLYLASWTNKTNLRDDGELQPKTTLDKLREETESLGESRGLNDRISVAIALDAINDGVNEDGVDQIDPLVNGFHEFVTKEVDGSIPKAVIVEELIDSCRDIADAPEGVFEEIEQGDPKKGMAVDVDLLSDKISEIASRRKKVKIKHEIAKKAISTRVSIAT